MLNVSGFSSCERCCYCRRRFEALGQPHLLVEEEGINMGSETSSKSVRLTPANSQKTNFYIRTGSKFQITRTTAVCIIARDVFFYSRVTAYRRDKIVLNHTDCLITSGRH
jgi:hypothetical protein